MQKLRYISIVWTTNLTTLKSFFTFHITMFKSTTLKNASFAFRDLDLKLLSQPQATKGNA